EDEVRQREQVAPACCPQPLAEWLSLVSPALIQQVAGALGGSDRHRGSFAQVVRSRSVWITPGCPAESGRAAGTRVGDGGRELPSRTCVASVPVRLGSAAQLLVHLGSVILRRIPVGEDEVIARDLGSALLGGRDRSLELRV